MAAMRAERENDVLANTQMINSRAKLHDLARRLMTRHDRQWQRPVAIHDVPVAHANAGGLHLDAGLAGLCPLLLHIENFEWFIDLGQHGRAPWVAPPG